MIKLLLENQSPVNATDSAGYTALHHGTRPKSRIFCEPGLSLTLLKAIAEGHGDAALLLLKAGAETNKRDVDEQLAINLAPDMKVL